MVAISGTTSTSVLLIVDEIVGVLAGLLVGLNDGPFATFGDNVGSIFECKGSKVGLNVGVGDIVGISDGFKVGVDVGKLVG